LEDSGTDAELVRLCKDCLAPEPGDRPRDAGVVARRVAEYLAGVQERLRAAELEKAAAQARAKEERKRRKLAVALAAAVLLAVLTGGGSYVLVQHQRQARQEQTALLVNEALGQVAALRAQAREAPLNDPAQRERAATLWGQTLAAADRAEEA